MKNKHVKLFMYIVPIIVGIFVMTLGSLFLFKDNKAIKEESNELTTLDVNKLLNDGTVFSKDYFNLNKLDGIELAASNDFTISVNNDLVTFYRPNTAGILYNTKNSYDTAEYISTAGGVINGDYAYMSLPNGTYYFYNFNTNYNSSNATLKQESLSAKGPITISNSCSNEVKNNQTSQFSVERCYYKYTNDSVSAVSQGSIGSCADGYKMTAKEVAYNGCEGIKVGNGLSRRYCRVIIKATCSKADSGNNPTPTPDPTPNPGGNGGGGSTSTSAATLTSAYVSDGSMTPTFKSTTYNYEVSVPGNIERISISGTPGDDSSFVEGMGSRTVELEYGNNDIQLQVRNSSGKVRAYTFHVIREDTRSSDNYLSALTVSEGELNPAFTKEVFEYEVEVEADIEKITIDATLADERSAYEVDYGPATYDLVDGQNKIYLKIKSETGHTSIYTINVNKKALPSECTLNAGEYGLLKSIILESDAQGIEIDQIEEFDSKVFNYKDLKVHNKVSSLRVNAFALDDADKNNITVEGYDELKVNVPQLITITVKSNYCPTIVNEYNLEVTRQPEVLKSTNPELENIEIKGYDIDFSKEKEVYGIRLKNGDDKLDISYEKSDEKTVCTIEGNEDLGIGSEVKIRCVAEDEDYTADYLISIDGVEKGTNIFLVIVVVIIIIIFLIYLLLKLLGYKVVLNFGVVGQFFNGMVEKIKNIFDK